MWGASGGSHSRREVETTARSPSCRRRRPWWKMSGVERSRRGGVFGRSRKVIEFEVELILDGGTHLHLYSSPARCRS